MGSKIATVIAVMFTGMREAGKTKEIVEDED